jgi:hypothetical protein
MGLAENITVTPTRLARQNVQHVSCIAILLHRPWQVYGSESGGRERDSVTIGKAPNGKHLGARQAFRFRGFHQVCFLFARAPQW